MPANGKKSNAPGIGLGAFYTNHYTNVGENYPRASSIAPAVPPSMPGMTWL